MFELVTTLAVLIVWWTLALLVALFRVKPNDKRYRKRGPGVGTVLGALGLGALFAFWTHNSGE